MAGTTPPGEARAILACMPGWWDKLRRPKGSEASAEPGPTPSPAKWLAPDDRGNPFGVPLLDLMVTQEFVATSKDPACATRALSWRTSIGTELDPADALRAPPIECALEFPAARQLPEGILYAPPSMDEKWVIAWRDGHVLAARSWTGRVDAVARAELVGDRLRIDRLWVVQESPLRLGPLPASFDWLIRAHALAQRIPFPLTEAAAELFERTPAAAFSAFGKAIFCGTRTWSPPPIRGALRSDGAIVQAVRDGDPAAIRRAVAEGDHVDAPSTFAGYTALHIAIVRGDLPAYRTLRELGASPTVLADRGAHALGIAIVHGAAMEIIESLVDAGLDPRTPNDDGFDALHATAETNRSELVHWLLAHGLSLENRTKHGHTALHIACALGHVETASALLDAGADPQATSPGGTPLDVARAERKAGTTALMESRVR